MLARLPLARRAVASVASVALAGGALALSACGGAAAAMAPSAPAGAGEGSPASFGGAGGGSAPAARAKMSGEIRRFEKASTHLRADKVGEADGSFEPDGVMDHVFDLDVDGPADGVLLTSTDDQGAPNGELAADTFTGDEALPQEVAGLGGFGKHTLGVGVYEGDRRLNATDGHLPALEPGKHGLMLYVSSRDAPRTGGVRVFVRFTDGSIVKGPVVKLR